MNDDNSKSVAQSESANFHFSGVRKHTSIRCDSNLWKAFKSVCKNNGFSTCNELEKLILGYLVGVSRMCHKPTTINVVVDAPRIIKRVRRRQLTFEDEINSEVSKSSVAKLTCDFCSREPVVASFRHLSGIKKRACDFHANVLRNHSKWSMLKNE